MSLKVKAYKLLEANKKKYKDYFYRTANELGITPAALSAIFTNKGRRPKQQAAMSFIADQQKLDFISTGESQD